MAQHDYSIANQSGAAFRSDLNNALSAIVSQNSGASAPSTTYAYMTWADIANGVMKMRNGANSAWITLYQLDGEWTSIAFENGTAAAPSIYFKDSGTDTGFFSPGTDSVGITTGGTERLRFASTGALGLSGANYGNSGQLLTSNGSASAPTWQDLSLSNVGDGTAAAPSIAFSADTNTGIYRPGADTFGISTGGSERVRVDSSGRLLVGTSTAFSNSAIQSSGIDSGIAIRTNSDGADFARYQAGSNGPFIFQSKSRNATIGSHTIVNNGDSLGGNEYLGSDGTNFIISARIEAQVDGTPGANDMPGRLLFWTTADGASSPTERFRIGSSGAFGLSGANYGSSGQMLTSNGSGSAPTWQSPINRGTAVASTSGTAIDFTSIPSWARRITVMLSAVSTNGTSNLLLQIGDSGGIETSGYVGSVDVWAATPGATLFGGTGFNLDNTATAAAVRHYVATVVNINGNTWVYTLTGARSNSAAIALAGGSKTLSDVLDRVRVTATNGTDSFDAGTINIFYEG